MLGGAISFANFGVHAVMTGIIVVVTRHTARATDDLHVFIRLFALLLVTLSAGELAVREHFAGYRSHSSLLAGICAIIVAIPVWLLPVPQELVLAAGVLAFLAGLYGFRRAFMRRSGGVGFRA